MKLTDEEFIRLAHSYFDGALDAAAAARLNEHIRNDPAAAPYLAELALDHVELRRVFAVGDADVQLQQFPKVRNWRRRWMWSAAALVVIGLVLTIYTFTGLNKTDIAIAEKPPTVVKSETVENVPTTAPVPTEQVKSDGQTDTKKEANKNTVTLTGGVIATKSSGREPKVTSVKLTSADRVTYFVTLDRNGSKLAQTHHGKTATVMAIVRDQDGEKWLTIRSVVNDEEEARSKSRLKKLGTDK